jgi:hypothetical protein
MKTPIDVFIGAPLEIESEILFLDHLISTLESWGDPVILCANFLTERNPHQIDFLVIAPRCVCHVELKSLTAPVLGQVNGQWSLCLPGDRRRILDGKNPYRQALDTKYALSDAMRDFAASRPRVPRPPGGEPFFKTFDTVVCVHPRLLPGSLVPSDYRVRVTDTHELFAMIRARQRTQVWSREQWLDFILHLGLQRREGDEPAARTLREQQTVVSAYFERCVASLRQDLPVLVPITATGPDGPVGTDSLRDLLARRAHAQLVGPSGAGKSHLARHVALTEFEAGGLVLVVSAREFDDRLSALLNRSVAHLHPGAAAEILDCAQKTGTRLSLVLDGVNECPPRMRKRLLRDVQALVLRWPLPVLVTAREPVELPSELQGAIYRFAPLTEHQRTAVLRAHAPAGVGEECFRLCEAFATPYELSLAGAVLGEVPPAVLHRAGLFDAYVRFRCDQTSHPITARLLLVAFAERMHERVKSGLTQLEVWQITEALCAQHGVRPQLVGDLIDSGLLESRRGRVSFRHELLERFFQAEAFVRSYPDAQDLCAALQRPICRPIVPLALGLIADAEPARKVLQALCSADLLADCICGECGPVAREAALAECGEAVRAGFRSLNELELRIEMPVAGERQMPHVTGGLLLAPMVRAGLRAVGLVVGEGVFLDHALTLARQTDEACRSALERQGVRPTVPVLQNLYNHFFGLSQHGQWPTLPSAVVHGGSGVWRSRTVRPALTEQLSALLGTLGSRSPGELLLLCNVLRWRSEAKPELVPELLRTCWATGLGQARVDALLVAQSSASVLPESARQQVQYVLGGLDSRNPFLSTFIMEAQLPYGMVESPVPHEQAAREIAEVLAAPENADSCEAAYRVLTNQLEDVVADAYSAAYEALEAGDRERLLARGVLGCPDCAMYTDWILRELVKLAGPTSVPAIQHWATVPRPDHFMPQEATSCFLTAVAACARLLDHPPEFQASAADDGAAWAAYGTILFWLQRPGLAEADRRARCTSVWERLLTELPFQAVDPLIRFATARPSLIQSEVDTLVTITQAFPDEVRRVLVFGLRHHSRLTTVFTCGPYDGYLGFLIAWLGRLGDQHTAPLLEDFLESPEVGATAAEALRAIRSR